jgi:hypothetical protein
MAELVHELGGTILDGPVEFPFAVDGYYAVYFLGPDSLKFEFVHMPALADYYGWDKGIAHSLSASREHYG